MSIEDISSPSLFDTSLATELTSVTRVTAITSSLDGNASDNPRDTPRQKRQSPANNGLNRFKADLRAQTSALSGEMSDDLTSLLKDLARGDTSAAKADVSKAQLDLQTQETSSVGPPTGEPLDTLIDKISDSLNSASVPGAPQEGAQHDLANFLVENGQGEGSLIDTSA